MMGSACILRAPFRILQNGFKNPSRRANSFEREEISGKMPRTARTMQALPQGRVLTESKITAHFFLGLIGGAPLGRLDFEMAILTTPNKAFRVTFEFIPALTDFPSFGLSD